MEVRREGPGARQLGSLVGPIESLTRLRLREDPYNLHGIMLAIQLQDGARAFEIEPESR